MNQLATTEVGELIRFKAQVSYHGGNFSGWAKQPDKRTVHAEIVKALVTVFGDTKDDFGMRVAGRTDAGVHALAQVFHFDVTPLRMKRIERGPDLLSRLNSLLPADIRLFNCDVAPEGFDARFSATGRRYIYRIADGKSHKAPKLARYALYFARPLDVEAMNDAAPAPSGKRRRILTTLALIFAVLGGVWWLLSHYVWGLREHTDDAYVAGHQISVSSQVPGTVIEVTVDDNQFVKKGQVLAHTNGELEGLKPLLQRVELTRHSARILRDLGLEDLNQVKERRSSQVLQPLGVNRFPIPFFFFTR
jgi:tRNA pseudouridine(38-40) synthase